MDRGHLSGHLDRAIEAQAGMKPPKTRRVVCGTRLPSGRSIQLSLGLSGGDFGSFSRWAPDALAPASRSTPANRAASRRGGRSYTSRARAVRC